MSRAPGPWEGTTILVAEENDATFEILRLILEIEGGTVLRAMTGSAALALGRVARPRIIVTDLALVDGPADAMVRALTSSGDTRDIPILALAPAGDQRARARALAAGCRAVLHKPVTAGALLDTLEALRG